MNIPIMYGQITNSVELRAFAVQIAANLSCKNTDQLLVEAKSIENYVKGSSELPENPQNPNAMYENLCKLMTSSFPKKEEETVS